MNMIERAIIFATRAHAGQTRKSSVTPYILHPLEAAAAAAALTDDPEIITAVALHDTVEDTDVTVEDIRREFGDAVAELVEGETEEAFDGLTREESWRLRKERSLNELKNAPKGVKIMWLSDKISNMRSFCELYSREGDAMWDHFNQKDKKVQEWYYRSIADSLREFSDTMVYKEYISRLDMLFREEENEILSK